MSGSDKRECRLVLLVQHYDEAKGHWVNAENPYDGDSMSFYTAGTREQVEEARKDILMPGWKSLMPGEEVQA